MFEGFADVPIVRGNADAAIDGQYDGPIRRCGVGLLMTDPISVEFQEISDMRQVAPVPSSAYKRNKALRQYRLGLGLRLGLQVRQKCQLAS